MKRSVGICLAALAVLVSIAGCGSGAEVSYDGIDFVKGYDCTADQFDKAAREARESIAIDKASGDDNAKRYPAWWLSTSIQRNCTKRGSEK